MRAVATAALVLLVAQGCALPSRGRAAASPHDAAPGEAGTPARDAGPAALRAESPARRDAGLVASTASVAPHEDPPVGDDIEGDEPDPHDANPADRPPSLARARPVVPWADDEIARRAREDAPSLGAISVGSPSAGLLVNGVQMPRGPRWVLLDPAHAWGTTESVEGLARAIDAVNEKFTDTHPIAIGHFSARHGGHLSPHKSHQSGRDVDVGYYYRTRDTRGFVLAHEGNLDLARTWALLRALVTTSDIDMIFVDTSIQRLLAEHALAVGEDVAFVDAIFQSRGHTRAPVVRHVHGHANHIHVRFHSPTAVEIGRRAARYLPRPAPPAAAPPPHGPPGGASGTSVASSTSSAAAPPATHIVMHRARSGDVMVNLAKHYGTTPEAIRQANGLKTDALKIGQTYKIPAAGPGPSPAKPATGTQHAASHGAPPSTHHQAPPKLPPPSKPPSHQGKGATARKS